MKDGPDSERKFWDMFIKGVSQVDFRDCHSDPAEYSGRINDTINALKETLEKIDAIHPNGEYERMAGNMQAIARDALQNIRSL